MKEVTLKVPTITCDGCVASIRQTVGKVQGVKALTGDPGKKTVTVTYDPALATVNAIVEAVGKAYHRVQYYEERQTQ